MFRHSYLPNLCLTAEAEQVRQAFNAMASTAPMCICDDTPGGACPRCDHAGSPRSQERNPDAWQLVPAVDMRRYIRLGFQDSAYSSFVLSILTAFSAQQGIQAGTQRTTETGTITRAAITSHERVSYAPFTWAHIPNWAIRNILRAMEVARSIKMELHREVRKAAQTPVSWCLRGFAYTPRDQDHTITKACFFVTGYSHDDYNTISEVLGTEGGSSIGFVSVETQTDAEKDEILRHAEYFFARSNLIDLNGAPIPYSQLLGHSGRVYVPREEINIAEGLAPSSTGSCFSIQMGSGGLISTLESRLTGAHVSLHGDGIY